mmetsp:Transcript_32903/g.82657  ORF Transcript_32903/g.82657 Transcript_32903/m.82657 type:complete len:364 (-) Transcript_32903:62-1153(-)|eukprot:CAMPEP_0177633208 /NCGR_PEP_ID=MMETSP0447-20121125/2712_1 /TAXON_ID=0 /ORGANISM="Stygamoeba regulata, Strain BSH-02190019" /LENGTH=363 /DNA_ID=CAMNT_0019134847 /DNA_START=51 /DNA_END=1142 /DNA_ORIENTATION=+
MSVTLSCRFAVLLVVALLVLSTVLPVESAVSSRHKKKKSSSSELATQEQIDNQWIRYLEAFHNSKAGVIVADEGFCDFLVGGPRNFTLALSWTQRVGCQYCAAFGRSFATVASAYRSHLYQTDALDQPTTFFIEVEHSACKNLFQRARVNSLPGVSLVPPTQRVNNAFGISAQLPMTHQMLQDPQEFADWIEEELSIKLEIPNQYMMQIWAVLLVSVSLVAWKPRETLRLLRSQKFMIVAALIVYWYSLTGWVFNRIHSPPWLGYNQETHETTFLANGMRQQFVFEGYLMATLHVAVGVIVTAIVKILPSLKNPLHQRIATGILLFLLFCTFNTFYAAFIKKVGMYPFQTYFSGLPWLPALLK